MSLNMKLTCEDCGTALTPRDECYICSYECTFCPDCTTETNAICPNCSGELVRRPRPPTEATESENTCHQTGEIMDPVNIDDLIHRHREQDGLFIEFLREDSLSMEVYRLPAGAEDPQDPHTEDEVYYVVAGEAKIRIENDTYPVEEGDIIFVEKETDHFFLDIKGGLITLVFFAPAQGTQEDPSRES